jgi:hypothetical protein
LFERYNEMDRDARRESARRVAALAQTGGARVFCAHDPVELGRLRGD